MREKNKALHENIDTIKHCLNLIEELDKGYIKRQFAIEIPTVIQEYLHAFQIAKLIDMVISARPWQDIILFLIIVGALELVLFIVQNIIRRHNNCHSFSYHTNQRRMIWEKIINMDYVHIENPDTYIKERQAIQGMGRMGRVFLNLLEIFSGTASIVLGIIMIAPLAFKSAPQLPGFAGFINSNFGLFSAIGIAAFLEIGKALLPIKKSYKMFSELQNDRELLQYSRTSSHYADDISSNYQNGKDIRIYGEQELILNEFRKNTESWLKGWTRGIKRDLPMNFSAGMITLASNIIMYGFAVLRAINGALTVGDIIGFVMYFSRIRDCMNRVAGGFGGMSVDLEFMKNAFDFLDIPDEKYKGTIPTEKRDDNEYEFEFRHVWFKYPNSEQYVLRDVNLKWRIGEKMALVGKNGCGKSTLVKLLCRLYDPTEGEITLNGIDIKKYKYEDYMALFSVVFQDSELFSFSIAENVASSDEYDPELVADCVTRAGLGERLKEMENGIETCLYKHFDEHGVEISGGEAQKLCLARAIYKGAPFIVLDEPTASLDPISEHDIYTKFNGI
ncbi:MAG: ABC transporter ATP-binding protein/permease, partial [Oscillospiraceae bacterium]|nr:ABC transporter ATP-binding protein/permease [Oscillospiraceae bacterium]